MECNYCGFKLPADGSMCPRCGTHNDDPPPAIASVDEVSCKGCGAVNHSSAEYCITCGAPMAVITRVTQMVRTREREELETWRVYGIETSMVGREAELQTLLNAHEEVATTGKLKTLAITADIGLGKSRLLAEFRRQLDARLSSTIVLTGESRDESSGPYSVFSRLLRQRFYIAEKEPPEMARRKLLEACKTIVGKDAERVAHLIGQIIEIGFENSPHIPEVGDTEGAVDLERRSYDALIQLFRADSVQNPLVVILEDLQFATRPVLALIAHMQKQLADAPILLIVSWNADEISEDHPVASFVSDLRLGLQPLSDREVRAFVNDTLRRASVPSGLIDRITEAAHGNPLTVEEFLRILIAENVIDTRTERWVVHVDRLKDVELPTTIEGAVEARLRALTDDERLVLGMAACIGQVFWPELVTALYHLHEDQTGVAIAHWSDTNLDTRVEDILESLERKDMIRRHEEALFADIEQSYFKHRLEQRKIYETLPLQERQRYHRLIPQWLERRLPSREGFEEAMASHYDRARSLEQAARHYLAAANAARQRYDHEHAISLYLKGLSYLSDSDIELKLTAFHDLGTVYDLLGEYDQALAYYREMLRYAWILNDRAKGGVGYNKIGRAHRSLGEYDRALEHFKIALDLFRSFDDLRGIASTLDDIGKIHWIRGNFVEAETHYTAGLHLRRESADERSVALSLNHLGSLKLQQGDLKEAMVYFREALELRRAVGDRQGVVDSFNNLGILLLERGDIDEAKTLFEEALESSKGMDYRGAQGIILNNLGELSLMTGQTHEARRYLEEALAGAEDGGDRRVIFDILRNLARLELSEFNKQVARERITDALQIAHQLDSDVLIASGMLGLADIHASSVFSSSPAEDHASMARECFVQAESLLRHIGNEAELAKCLMSFGRFCLETQQDDEASEYLSDAAQIFGRLGMRRMVDQVQNLMSSVGQSPESF
ncbi:MAG: tetratricopeptide repeat protein [bacterium]